MFRKVFFTVAATLVLLSAPLAHAGGGAGEVLGALWGAYAGAHIGEGSARAPAIVTGAVIGAEIGRSFDRSYYGYRGGYSHGGCDAYTHNPGAHGACLRGASDRARAYQRELEQEAYCQGGGRCYHNNRYHRRYHRRW